MSTIHHVKSGMSLYDTLCPVQNTFKCYTIHYMIPSSPVRDTIKLYDYTMSSPSKKWYATTTIYGWRETGQSTGGFTVIPGSSVTVSATARGGPTLPTCGGRQ